MTVLYHAGRDCENVQPKVTEIKAEHLEVEPNLI